MLPSLCYIETMTTTFLDIKTDVQNLVIDLPTTVQNMVPTLVIEAVRHIQTKHNFKIMEALGSFTTVEGVRALSALPANFKEFRNEPYFVLDDGTRRWLTLASDRESAIGAIGEDDTNYPMVLIAGEPTDEISAVTLEVWPLPDGNSDYVDGEYRIRLPYWKFLADLSADGDVNWFTNNARDFITYRATSNAFAADWDYDAMALWLQKSEIEKATAIMRDKMLRISGVQELVPLWEGARSPRLRW